MENHVDEMVWSTGQTEQLAIQHMREPVEGKPIGVVHGSKRPLDASPSEAVAHAWVVGHRTGVIIIDEIMSPDAAVRGKDGHEERRVNPYVPRSGTCWLVVLPAFLGSPFHRVPV